jgi:hypothetical protein
MKVLKYILALSLTVVALSGCKDEDDNSDGKAKITLAFTPQAGSSDFALNTEFHVNGVHAQLSTARFYISNVRLVDHEGVEFPVNKYFLVKIGEANSFDLGEFQADHYHKLRFDVGIDSATNHADPTVQPEGSALALQADFSMHWDWNMGYRFLVLEGVADTTGLHPSTLNVPIEYHVGFDANLTPVEIETDLETDGAADETLAINVDLQKLLTGLDFKTEPSSQHGMNSAVVAKIVANIPDAFTAQ